MATPFKWFIRTALFRGLKPMATIFVSGLHPWWFKIYNVLYNRRLN
jgi:hypothetical protein